MIPIRNQNLVLIENSVERFPVFTALSLPEVWYFIETHPHFDKNWLLFPGSKAKLNQGFAQSTHLLDPSVFALKNWILEHKIIQNLNFMDSSWIDIPKLLYSQ